jgi:hypothetical protein
VAEVEAELASMDAQFKSIQASAKRWPRFWTTTGCVVLFGQLVGFVYLTWWELSWDVMEPVAYILGLTYSFLAYVYFLVTRGAYLDYGPFQEYWTEQMMVGGGGGGGWGGCLGPSLGVLNMETLLPCWWGLLAGTSA